MRLKPDEVTSYGIYKVRPASGICADRAHGAITINMQGTRFYKEAAFDEVSAAELKKAAKEAKEAQV